MSIPFSQFSSQILGSIISEILGSSTTESFGTAAFISTGIFLFVFITIAFQLLHETAAALLGAVAVLLVTYIWGSYNPSIQLLTFEEAIEVVDWNVIFLIMGMMIFMAFSAETDVLK